MSGPAPLARYAPFRRVGDFVFISAIVPVDPELKRVVRGFGDLPEPAQRQLAAMSAQPAEQVVLAQSWAVLDRVRETVEAAGGGMGDVFKLVQYFRDLKHFQPYNAVRKLFFPGEPPVSTVVEASGLMPGREVLLQVEATAYLSAKAQG